MTRIGRQISPANRVCGSDASLAVVSFHALNCANPYSYVSDGHGAV